MATLGDLKARVADELMKRNLTTQIAQHIGRAVEHYAGRRFWFNTGRMVGSALTPDGEGYVALPAGTRLIDEIRIGRMTLAPRDAWEIEAWLNDTPATALEPTDYAVAGERVRLYPTPMGAVALTVVGTFDVTPALSSDLVSNAWTNEAADLIAARTRLTMYRDVLRDAEGAAMANAAVKDADDDLTSKTTRRLGRGRVRAHL